MIPVSDKTKQCIEALFTEAQWQQVSDYLLSECGDNLVDGPYLELAERIRFAVLKLSNGDFRQLVTETENAAIDWRDTLVAAGFGDDTKAHLAWAPGVRESETHN